MFLPSHKKEMLVGKKMTDVAHGRKVILSIEKRTTTHMGRNAMKTIWGGVLFLLLVSVSIPNAAFIYKWVDKDGSVNFTDDLNKVPPEYRNQVQTEETKDFEKTQIPPSSPASVQKTGEGKRDAHGRGEQYWRETVRPWKEKLKQAQEDCNNTNMKIEDAIEMVKGRFYSHTQYNLKRVELERLMAERVAYEAQMKEAEEMLARIVKEAEEAKADPAWLK
jgi:Domain of unknown function (DUF4124)